MKVSAVMPIYNEEKNINEMYSRLSVVLKEEYNQYEILYVNDGSSDDSLKLLKELREKDKNVRIVDFSRNFGHQIAVSAGLEYAKGDVVIVMDADLQDPPEMIPEFVEKYQEGYDVVYAIRKKRKGESIVKKVLCKIYYKVLKLMTDFEIPLDAGDFRLYSRRAVDRINSLGEKRRFIRGLSSWIGFKQAGVEYVRPARFAGETKYSFRQLASLAWEGITALSLKPLRIATYLGAVVSSIAFIYIVWVLYKRLFSNTFIEGWTSLMTVILFLGGVQLLCIGIIGEYIGRTAEETRNRPLYIVDKVYE